MAGISIHVIDVSRGVPAAGLAVAVFRSENGALQSLSTGAIDGKGHYDDAALMTRVMVPGRYVARFDIGDYYRSAGVAVAEPAFLERVSFEFGIAEPAQHYHLPLKMTPWGYSLFRGGS